MEAVDELKGEHEAQGKHQGDGDVGLKPGKQVQHGEMCTQYRKGGIVVSKANAVKYL
ncbi:hypothetical protein JOS77_05750 [Chromobacterium haemolyticum]|nr:hypothetical protein JOS77_05750 [Chromobacterium haemolyticum]